MNHWQGKWALITGASAGIGTALARELAAGGTNLVLTARRRDRLAGLAGELSAKHDIRTLVCVADLAQPAGPHEIFTYTEGKNISVDLLVNNAGFGAYGEFLRLCPTSRRMRRRNRLTCNLPKVSPKRCGITEFACARSAPDQRRANFSKLPARGTTRGVLRRQPRKSRAWDCAPWRRERVR